MRVADFFFAFFHRGDCDGAGPYARSLPTAYSSGALTSDLGYTRVQVEKINVNEWSTYVSVDRAIAQQVASRLATTRVKGKSVKVRVLED